LSARRFRGGERKREEGDLLLVVIALSARVAA
jgi:hypothetical protein